MRIETKIRARALQLLYAWEVQGDQKISEVAYWLLKLPGADRTPGLDAAESTATAVVETIERLDAEISARADNWRMERLGAVERNILRLGLHELLTADTPAPVVIDESVKLAHWFAGVKAPGFINGILDGLAREHGKL